MKLFKNDVQYMFVWDDGTGGEEYAFGDVIAEEGTVISVAYTDGKTGVINTATPKFIRADYHAPHPSS